MDFIDDFIKEYKCNPCLWKADSVDFKNRTKRQEAYMKLIDVATKHGEHYNVERTKQKINNLRCAFRHQLKKCNEFKKKGEKYEPYCPKRKYFESLMFLKDEEIPDKRTKREVKETLDSREENTIGCGAPSEQQCNDYLDSDGGMQRNMSEGEKFISSGSTQFCFEDAIPAEPTIKTTPKRSTVSIKDVEVILPADNHQIHDSVEGKQLLTSNIIELTNLGKDQIETQIFEFEKDGSGGGILHQKPQNKRYARKRSSSVSSQVSNETEQQISGKPIKADISSIDFEKLLSLAFKNMNSNIDDHFTNFGKIIAHKLRCMDPTQTIYAEKIIADVLYQGQMKMLSHLSIHQIQNSNSDNSQVYAENHNK